MAHEVDLESFKELERDIILRVLYRDQTVQSTEEERVRKLKSHLQHLRWKGAKSSSQEYKEKCCARCQRALGLLLNRGAVCQGCSHRVCSECRVFLRRTRAWKCTVCFEDRNVKIKTGEWFFEERARKFPTAELSKSQNDMTSEKHLLAMDPRQCVGHTERRSQSDTAVNVTSRKASTPDILKAFHQEDPKHPPDPVLKQDTPPSSPTHSAVFSGGLRHGASTAPAQRWVILTMLMSLEK
ncbi:synaptotagmin-like protein 3 isoform X1 [Mus musculus]|uniref:synaptotagmin-like protein 3 isoform X1 n=1 Tax=Mus musculus TaxID=10090 RepID=UPI00167C268E|nr:synaptotagmin-like protein 3 isoform X1 [Mus musculus]XP_036016757.1 synaptotagmin-like protein 3 isoform X1 [Mus musculus]